MVVALRCLALALFGLRLYLVDRGEPDAEGFLPALVVGGLAAVAIVTEPRSGPRRTALVVALITYAAWTRHVEDAIWLTAPGLLVLEIVVVLVCVETAVWRWSMIPGALLLCWLVFHALPWSYGGPDDVERRISWLFFALLLMIANAAVRSMREEDDVSRRPASPGSRTA